MMSSFRRLSKSKVGTSILVLFLVVIVGSFAVADMSNLNMGGMRSGTLAKAGGETLTERDVQTTFDRLLAQRRQENPNLTSAALASEYEGIVDELINERLLAAFAEDHGVLLSRRLVDAQIAKIPGARGLDGKFSDDAYARWLQSERMDDNFVRRALSADLLRQLILLPAASSPRISTGMATPYASALLEQRDGEVVLVATDAFKAGLTPSAGDLQTFYDQNKGRYTVPEQRVLRFATITPASVTPATPTEAEIAAYYKANAATYGGAERRVLSQAVVPDQRAAAAIAQRLKSGASFTAAAAPAGLSAEDVSVGPQTREEFTGLAGEAVANQTFSAASGAIVGPVRSDLGWHVVKIESIQAASGKSLADARGEIVAKLTEDKRKDALADVVARVEDAIADGASLPDAAAAAKIALSDTPLIQASGTSRTNAGFKLDPNLAPALKTGFELAEGDDPVVDELADKSGYVVVGVGRIVAAAPAPLAEIRDRVAADWLQKKAASLARAAAAGIAAKAAAGQSLADAARGGGRGVSPVQPLTARRLDIARASADTAAPLRMLFSLPAGKSRMVADPQERGFFIVANRKITPGNAATRPALISQTQLGFQQSMAGELAAQFLNSLKKSQGVKRDDAAIQAAKARLTQVAN